MEDETLFLRFFGRNPVMKVLDFLIDNEVFDYSKTDIAKNTGISRTTLLNIWKNLEEAGIVIETRKVGRAKMYMLNKNNPIVKKFMELDDALSDYYASKVGEELILKT